MGAWGHTPFTNDQALDWLQRLEAGGISELRAALTTAATYPADEYLDVDDGSAAIAAAKVVALAFDAEPERLPAEVTRWLAAEGAALNATDAALAKQAVARVLGEQSELSSLWEGHGSDSEWHTLTRALLAHLTTHAGTAPAPSPASQREVGVREKQTLFVFLQVRGLELTTPQRARIHARDRAEIQRWLARVMTVASVDELFDD